MEEISCDGRTDKGVEAAIGYVEAIPSVKPDSKELSPTHKALDTISRQDAIDAVQKLRDAEVRQYGKVPCKG